jgi:hypothetical protein
MTIPNAHWLDRLDPMQRLQFDEKEIRTWRVTWPDGTTELIRGHSLQYSGEGDIASFLYYFLGPHRYINLAHVRDIAEVDGESNVKGD